MKKEEEEKEQSRKGTRRKPLTIDGGTGKCSAHYQKMKDHYKRRKIKQKKPYQGRTRGERKNQGAKNGRKNRA